MSTVIMTANYISALFLLVLVIGIYATNRNVARTTKWYRGMVWACLIGLIINGTSYAFDMWITNAFLLTVINYLAFISADILLTFYVIYVYIYIKDANVNLSKKYLIFTLSLVGVDFLINTIGVITKGLFYIEDGVIIEGPLWDYTAIIPAGCLIIMMIFLIVNMKRIGVGNAFALGSHLLITMALTIVQIINPAFEFSYIGASLAMLIIYVIIQSKVITEAKIRTEVLNDLTTKDVLTGLKNRRGYEDVIKSIMDLNQVGAIFCDINSLKEVNDTLGHDKGDELIQSFSEILKNEFSDGEICRISGDEFVALVSYDDEESFQKRMDAFKALMAEKDKMAAVGYSTGVGSEALEIIKNAEKNMYLDKKKYYEETGKIRRF